MTSGMGGMRTSGDLVARMQMTKGIKIKAAKEYVADKLGVAMHELTDAAVMGDGEHTEAVFLNLTGRSLRD